MGFNWSNTQYFCGLKIPLLSKQEFGPAVKPLVFIV